ncbi:MAG TPA: heparinase II/III family protein, partial [Pyrinomonadaceae bacterium]|nr:heparinase II/III family protein [Pyrinomonadaceae bacterium]
MSRTFEKNKQTQRARILIVAPSLGIVGGQSVQAARLMAHLRKDDSVEVGYLPINPRGRGISGKLQKIKFGRTVITSVLYVASLLRTVRNYDVIHIFSASYFSFVLAPTPAILIAKLFRKRVLLNYHSGEAGDHFSRWPSAVATLRLADELIVPSNYLVRVFRNFGLSATAINNVAQLDEIAFKIRPEIKANFLSNRNFEKHYGVDDVLRAFALIQQTIPTARLTVAGDGNQRDTLKKLAIDLALQNVQFVGQIAPDEMAGLYANSDVFLNASKVDNQPLSILEAFAGGLPVITTNVGGIPDMVSGGVNGFLAEPGDYHAIAQHALQILGDSQLAKRVTTNAVEACNAYNWRTVGPKWISVYQHLASTGKRIHPASRLQKLRNSSFDEVRERTKQAVASFAERHGWSPQLRISSEKQFLASLTTNVDSAESCFKQFRERSTTQFFPSFSTRAATLAVFRDLWPEAAPKIMLEADQICEGRFNLLGLTDLDFGQPINWRLEPISQKATELVHWSELNFLDPGVAGDKKITWELNRHQYFVKLGQAYWLSGNEKYAATFVAHLESWMDENPPKLGINWASSLEVSFRSIAWIWALHFFADSPSLTASIYLRALQFLRSQGRHIETFLSTYFSPNTHLTGEALGLFYLGSVFPEFAEAQRWRTLGRKILNEQIQRQVRSDGVYFEQSSYYHRYTTDFLTHFLILSRVHNEELPSNLQPTLEALLDHLMYITRPDGTTPLFGDEDGGRLLCLDQRKSNDFRATLSNGAILCNRGDYKSVAGELAEETLWLLGPNATTDFTSIVATEPAETCKAFPAGGYFVMKDGWNAEANYLLFDCGPHGTDNCGHAHADALAVEIGAGGQSLIVDSGTFTYTGSRELRDWFRSSQAHNTISIDGESSSVPAGPFSWSTVANSQPLSWMDAHRFAFVEGSHDGFERLPVPARHTRGILFLKNDYFVMRDRVSSAGPHDIELRFHLAPHLIPEITAQQVRVSPHKVGGLQLFTAGPAGSWSEEKAPFSASYGHRTEAAVCKFSARFAGTSDLVTAVMPLASSAAIEVREVESIGGAAIEIITEQHRDIIMVRGEQSPRVETVNFVSDFNWTWARFERNAGFTR